MTDTIAQYDITTLSDDAGASRYIAAVCIVLIMIMCVFRMRKKSTIRATALPAKPTVSVIDADGNKFVIPGM